ncbi:MAG: phosphatidate cytidylyltransferase [Rickettsiales bacterium]
MDVQAIKNKLFSADSELKRRIITGGALAVATFAFIILGGFPFYALIILAAVYMHQEWQALTVTNGNFWKIAGIFYVVLPCSSLIVLRQMAFEGTVIDAASLEYMTRPYLTPLLALFPIITVAATDIGAYIAGKLIGGPKLAPSISPGKTWAGLIGGMLSASVAGVILFPFTPFPHSFMSGLGVGALLALLAQMGDLFESWLKRQAGVKDSGTLFPGHGGILDRVDGHAIAIPVFTLLAWMAGGIVP